MKRQDARSLVEKFISQVVEQGKLEAGARYFSPEAQDVHRLVETSIARLHNVASDINITIESIDVEPDQVVVREMIEASVPRLGAGTRVSFHAQNRFRLRGGKFTHIAGSVDPQEVHILSKLRLAADDQDDEVIVWPYGIRPPAEPIG